MLTPPLDFRPPWPPNIRVFNAVFKKEISRQIVTLSRVKGNLKMIDIDIVFFAGGIGPSLLQHGKGTNYVNSPFPLSFAIVLCLPFPFWQLIIGTRAKSKISFQGGPRRRRRRRAWMGSPCKGRTRRASCWQWQVWNKIIPSMWEFYRSMYIQSGVSRNSRFPWIQTSHFPSRGILNFLSRSRENKVWARN